MEKDGVRFFQALFDANKSASTLRVYVAAISASRVPVDGLTIGSYYPVRHVLKGVQWLRPPEVLRASSWDLQMAISLHVAGPENGIPTCHCLSKGR